MVKGMLKENFLDPNAVIIGVWGLENLEPNTVKSLQNWDTCCVTQSNDGTLTCMKLEQAHTEEEGLVDCSLLYTQLWYREKWLQS